MTGTVVFSSIGDTLDDAWAPAADAANGKDGQSFTSASGSTTITDVKLSLTDTTNGDGGHLTVELWSSSGNAPASQLATLGTIADSSLTSSFATIDLTVGGAPTLTAGTRYWIVLAAASGSSAEWGATFSTNGTEVSTEYQSTQGTASPDTANEAFLMSVTTDTACFAAGTRILTPRGEVAVESLREGDRVVTARDGGRLAPVRWVGRRTLSPARHPRPWDVNPIRLRAGALGPGRPSRDLLLSPDHSLFIGGVLMRARDLLNGATVVQDSPETVTYFHIELDRHDVLLAEGVPAESFLDTGNRGAFENGGVPVQAHPEFARRAWERHACAKLVWEGTKLAEARAMLAARAEQLGWELTARADLHVTARGRTIRPVMDGGAMVFDLPNGCGTVCVRSRAAVPAFVLPGVTDTRVLGVGVTSLALDGVPVALDEAALGDGWLSPESGLRWTDGAATVRVDGARRLTLGVASLLRYWIAPPDMDIAAPRAA